MEKKVQKSFLKNGIEVVTESIPYVRSISVGFWIKTGSRDEHKSLNGMSHFIEHLIFKGTENRSAKEISETFDGLGAEINAFTGKECTCYYARLLDKNLPIAAEVLSDMLSKPAFRSDDIKSEKEVILEEISLHEDSPDERVHDLFAETLWDGHPLGEKILGSLDTVKKFKREDVIGCFKKHYTPKNMIITAAGNLKHEDVFNLAHTYLRGTDRDSVFNKKTKIDVKSRVKIEYKKTEQAHICYGCEGLPAAHKDRFALSILDSVLGGGMSSRFFQEIREKRGLAYTVYSYHSFYRDTGSFVVYAGTRPANAEKVLDLIKTEINKVVTKGIKVDELNRAKEQIKGQLILGLESTGTRMMRLGKSEITHGEILSLSELINCIEKVKLEDVQRVARNIFLPEKTVLTIIGPVKKDMFVI
ncbi:pitrilysin family protein [Candidatus Oleimmundimicrobium sp.]|uniref:M16 family metallopeptidase n=1 Tax=Candidatus Oleimmundimicrobium sp. TaxID=3060597 RepID=UPI00271FD0FA|nr:pitrilysin family protein [Candidatus Oleimmundimicrobium sp.]MDO8885441.1 pitrilysin family protein [Candidatus Oleimmundimicrobium sp.]